MRNRWLIAALGFALGAVPALSPAPDGLIFGSATSCGVYLDGSDVTFARCNVRVVNGTGATDQGNGTGNLLLGYESREELGDESSHNLLIGDGHILLGNTTRGLFAGESHVGAGHGIVALGSMHQAFGDWTTLVGGEANSASGEYSTVLGGQFSRATGEWATVDGGYQNTASGLWSWVGGGNHAQATNTVASSVGGLFTHAKHVRSVAIGTLAATTKPDDIAFGRPLAP